MRIIGLFERQDQVGGFIDTIRNIGLDRKDIIVSDMTKTRYRNSALDNVYIKTETDSLNSLSTLSDTFTDKFDTGIIVAVEVSKKNTSRIREIMEQSGVKEILQD